MAAKKTPLQVVKWLVQSRFTGHIIWHDHPPTAYERTVFNVLAYGMDDGTLRWRAS